MKKLVLCIYDWFRKYPSAAWTIFLIITGLMVYLLTTLSYKEDISDFLPLDEKNQTALSVYQDVSGANRIYTIVSLRDAEKLDPQQIVDGIELFSSEIENLDSLHLIKSMMKEIDMDRFIGVADDIYKNIPYFLTESDYSRIDSLLKDPDFIEKQLERDKETLLFPGSGMMASNISRDPLNLFTPVLNKLQQGGMPVDFEVYDGYILTPDNRKAIMILESSFGASESEHNGALVDLLSQVKKKAEEVNPELEFHIIGGPAIAVANAERIKRDSIMAVCVAGLLILLLLIYVFRNLRNMLLIIVSVGWGWLFAMAGIALYYDSVSIIVIGIASVILGIAVNYPLHLIDHLKGSDHPRSALKEIISPLVVGNVTTVGAFLCLVPLNSPALHDLGLFSSLLLVGTILFVLLFLPHAVKTRRKGERPMKEPRLIGLLGGINLENNKWLVGVVILLTIVFGYFSLKTEFDTDLRNINYMTPEQKDDMDYFQNLTKQSTGTESLYVVSTSNEWDKTLRQKETIESGIDSLISAGLVTRQNGVSDFLFSLDTQKSRLNRWESFINDNRDILLDRLKQTGGKYGFSELAFEDFETILKADYGVKEFDDFKDILSEVFIGNISEERATGRKSLVEVLNVPEENMESVKHHLESNHEFGGLFFDVKSMNGSIANTLSDDFNYIGLACGIIVFFFLWISLGSIELAIVSFLPMAVSWIWILGIMGLLGLKFNIVNVILATFIFGQGDDYTIFMTEGLTYEFAYRRKLLGSYKNSIIVSALIMFIGIGTLIFAKHPALRSLGEVTVVGMLSVVFMAYLFPPLVFNFLVRKNGCLRYRPITLRNAIERLLNPKRFIDNAEKAANCDDTVKLCALILDRYRYKGAEIESNAKKRLKEIAITDIKPWLSEPQENDGPLALLIAVKNPEREVIVRISDREQREILRGCSENFTPNLNILE